MINIALITFAVLPSLVWMFFYLQKDSHPEPRHLVLLTFIAGGVTAFLGYFIQTEIYSLITLFEMRVEIIPVIATAILLLKEFVVIAFSEELLKYLAVFFVVMRSPEMDDPVDLIIYMIVAALGFAAVENFFVLYSFGPQILVEQMAVVSLLRFAGATFLHALASGTLGVFLVYAYRKSSTAIMVLGFITASLVHGAYNMLVVRVEYSGLNFLLFIILLLSLAVFISVGIGKAKKMKSVCYIN